jgi:putative hydrolase of the HAD superfamily
MKLFIFDMGGVLAGNTATIPAIAKSLGIAEADFFKAAGSDPAATHTSPYHLGDIAALMEGKLSAEQFWKNFSARSGVTVRGDPWYDYFQPEIDRTVAALIHDLRKAGRRVVCGTNTLDAHYRKHRQRGDYDPFDKVYASQLMGVIKPHPEFWRYILREENAKPEDTFFTDDAEENILAAEKLGLKVHHFTGVDGLRKALNGL